MLNIEVNMNYLLIAIAIFLFVIQSICFKLFNLHFMKDSSKYYFYSFMYSILIAVIFSFSSGAFSAIDKYTIILSIPFGVLFIFTVYFFAKALETGPMSYSALLYSLSLLFPITYGVIVLDEKFSLLHLLGLILLMVTFYLASTGKKSNKNTISLKWLIFALIAMIGNGSIGIIQKVHQMYLPGEQVSEYLMLAFIVAAVVSLILFAINTKTIKLPFKELKQKKYIFVLLGTVLSTAFGHQIILYLVGRVDAIILFPAINGLLLIFTGIASYFVFKEKLSKRSLIGFIIGVIAIIIINVG